MSKRKDAGAALRLLAELVSELETINKPFRHGEASDEIHHRAIGAATVLAGLVAAELGDEGLKDRAYGLILGVAVLKRPVPR